MKNPLKRKNKVQNASASEAPARITNETVAEHREQVLAGGRKFKYPVQYQKHKLVINSILIGTIAAALVSFFGWQQLYVNQDISKLTYRVTQLLPLNVAAVDGEGVRYSDYLMRLRSSVYYLEKQDSLRLNAADGKNQLEYIKREELNNAEKSAYVRKLAHEQKVAIADDEVTRFIQRDLDARSVSLNAYEKTVLNSYYDWSLDEYRSIVRDQLLQRKVGFAIDNVAKKKAQELLKLVSGGKNIAAVAKESSDDALTKANGGDSGDVTLTGLDTNGLIAAAKQLDIGRLSGLLEGTDGYYFIRLTAKDDDSVRYRVVKVALRLLDEQFDALRRDGKVKEYISVAQQFK